MNNRKFKYIPGLLAVVWAVFVFFQYVNNHVSYLKAFNLLDAMIFPLFLLSLLALLAYALGRTLIRFLRGADMESATCFLFSSALGFMIFALGTAALAFLQILTKTAALIFLISLFAFSRREILNALKSMKIRIPAFSSFYDIALALILLLFIAMNLLFALAPPSGLDEQQYHLNAPQTYIRNRGFVRIDNMGEQTKFPQNIETLYTLAMLIHGDILAKLINYYFGILCLLLIYALVRNFFSFKALLPCAMFYCGWLAYYISTRANIDLGLAFFEGVMILSLLLWLDQRASSEKTIKRDFFFYLSAVCAGFSLGIKYTALFSMLGVTGIFLFYGAQEWKTKSRQWIACFAIYGFIALTVFSPWLIRNAVLYKAPFAPYRILNHLRLATSAGNQERDDSDSLDPIARLRRRNALLYKGVYPRSSLLEFILIPYNATIYGDWPMPIFDTLVAPFYLMFFPFIFFVRKKPGYVVALVIHIMIVYCLWHIMQPITRYLTPVLVLMSLLLAYVIDRMKQVDHILTRYVMISVKGIILVTLLITLAAQMLIFASINPLYYLMGWENKSSYLTRANPAGIQPVIDYVNENLEPESRILLLWEKRGYYLERDYKEDASGNILALAMYKTGNPKDAARELKNMGFTHILADVSLPLNWFGSGYKKGGENPAIREMGSRELEFFRSLAEESLELLEKSRFIYLYRID